nr:DUF2029 domain-containing protein [Chloroflexaceae bacterium]
MTNPQPPIEPAFEPFAWRTVALELAAGGLALLLAVLLLAVGYGFAWPLTLEVGQRDGRFVGGFHETERLDGEPGRWTTDDSTLALPRPPEGQPARLTLRLASGRTENQPDPRLRLSADGRALAQFDVVRRIDGTRLYHVLVPPTSRADWALRLGLASDTFSPPGDRRTLGLALNHVELHALGGGWLPAFWVLGWAAAIGGLSYALLRSVGVGRMLALGLTGLLAALLAWGVAVRPLEILPYLQRLAALPALGLLGVALAVLLLPLRGGRATGGAVLVPGTVLPVLLGLGWWLPLGFQLALDLDGAVGVHPADLALWTGGVLLVGLLVLGAWGQFSGKREQAAHWALGLLAAAALVMIVEQLRFAFSRQAPDFWILFKGTRDWARGGSLYDLEAVLTNHFGHVFKVPPFYAMFFAPFVFQPGELVLLGHRIINTMLIGATALLWAWMSYELRVTSYELPRTDTSMQPIVNRQSSIELILGLLILFNFRPLFDTLSFGQIDLLLLLLLTLALAALQRGRDGLAGVLVALGTLFKIYPLLLLAFFVLKGRWRALGGFALAMLACNGLAVLVMGWEMHRVYLLEVVPRIGGTTAWIENQTISGFIARWFDNPEEATIFANRPLALLGLGLSALLSALVCLLALRRAEGRSTTFLLQYGLFLLLMVLAVPAAWMHYQTLLVLLFGALLLRWRERELPLGRALLLALSFGLIAHGNQWTFFSGQVDGILATLGLSYKMYGMLLLGGLVLAELKPLETLRDVTA